MTHVIQTPPPLKLRSRNDAIAGAVSAAAARVQSEISQLGKHDLSDLPPSYPMQPFDIGMDLYEPTPGDESASGIWRRAPHQPGHWRIVPSYARALPFVIDTKGLTLWSRGLEPLVASGWNPEAVLKTLSEFHIPERARWLHCLRINPERLNALRYAIVVVDFLHGTMPHGDRREILENTFPEIGIRVKPALNSMHLIPEFPENMAEDVWAGLTLTNAEWREPFYDGVDMRQASTTYTMQMVDYQQRSMKWLHHPFAKISVDESPS